MAHNICKETCKLDPFFLERKAKKFGYNNNEVYGFLRKYCATCEFYIHFKSELEFKTYISCPCCGHRFRVRPAGKASRRSFHKRTNYVKVYY